MTQQIPADQSSTVPPEVKFNFEIDGRGYELYTHSYLGFGGEQARESLNRAITPLITPKNTLLDPCINEGFMKERLPSSGVPTALAAMYSAVSFMGRNFHSP